MGILPFPNQSGLFLTLPNRTGNKKIHSGFPEWILIWFSVDRKLCSRFFFLDHLTFVVQFTIQPECSVWQMEFTCSRAFVKSWCCQFIVSSPFVPPGCRNFVFRMCHFYVYLTYSLFFNFFNISHLGSTRSSVGSMSSEGISSSSSTSSE